MAAALAIQGTPNMSSLNKMIGKKQSQEEVEYPQELKIFKANSVNQRYMTELVGTQKMSPSKIDPASVLRS